MQEGNFYQLAELIITFFSMIGTISIGIIGGYIAYINTYGNKPIALITRNGFISRSEGYPSFFIITEIELINNRNYPISLRSLIIEYKGIELHFAGTFFQNQKSDWLIKGNTAIYNGSLETINPGEYIKYLARIPTEKVKINETVEKIIKIKYFDSYCGKIKKINLNEACNIFYVPNLP